MTLFAVPIVRDKDIHADHGDNKLKIYGFLEPIIKKGFRWSMHRERDFRNSQLYKAVVPDTLDLSERARAGVKILTEIISQPPNHQPFQKGHYYRNPPVFSNEPGGYVFINGNEMWGKAAEALLEMRLMSGSQQHADLDDKTFAGMVNCIEVDNLFYSIVGKVEGSHLVKSEDFADLVGGARVMLGLIAKYQLDNNPEWLGYLARLAKGFRDFAIYKEDYAYYPDGHMGGAVSRPRSGWLNDHEPIGTSLYETKEWYENATNVIFTFGGIIQALCRWYLISNEPESLDLAGKLVKFVLKPRFWKPEAEPESIVSEAHAHFEGHIHATVRGLWGLLEYAILTNDEKLKAFVRDGYNYVRTFGIARIGLFGEGCTVGDMTCLAIKLTDAGIGDYWEDVDQYVRNHLTEIQILDEDPIRRIAKVSPVKDVMSWEDADRFVERQIGALCDDATHPTLATPGTMHCCTYNGLIGFYHAWEGIVRGKGGVVQVNLLLNRASQWLDIDSYLPCEGKVQIHNKNASVISVRMPRWVDLQAVRSWLEGGEVQPYSLGRCLVFDQVPPGNTLTVEFPVTESTETYQVGWEGHQIPGWTEVSRPLVTNQPSQPYEYVVSTGQNKPETLTTFTCSFKGNTLVDIVPREVGLGYPLYHREHYKQGKAPMVEVARYVAPKLIDL